MRVTNSVLDRVERVDRVEWICMFDTAFNQMPKKAVVLLVASLMAASLNAAPTLKALWLTNAQNTNSVKPAIDRLAKRIGIPIALERQDITPFEKAKAISDADLKPLLEIKPDFVVMSFGENVKCKTAYGAEMAKWIGFFRSFRALPSHPEMVMCGKVDEKNAKERESPIWRTLVAATARGETDFIMAGDLDAEGLNSRIADILYARTFPRIVPINPKLSEIDPMTGVIELYYPGRFPKGRENYILDVGMDGVWRTSSPIGADGFVRLRLGATTEGAHSLRVQLTDLTVGRRPAVSQSVYQICAKHAFEYDTGRRLNNLVTELYAGSLVDGRVEFVNPRDGYVAFVVDGGAMWSLRPLMRLDGENENIMPAADDEPTIAMRWVSAGRHVVSVVNGQDARCPRLSIRAVKAIRNRDANGDWSDLRRRFVIPYANIGTPWNDSGLERAFGGGSVSNGIVRLARRGHRLIPSVNMDPHGLALRRDIQTVEEKIRNSVAWRLGMEVAVDENRVGVETEYLHHYTMAEAIWQLSMPSQAINMFWAGCTHGNKFACPESMVSELSAIANSGGGKGLNIFETYQRSTRNFNDVEKQFDDTIACMKSMADMVPATKRTALCHFGTYYFPGNYTPLASPYADHRVLLDKWVKRVATESDLGDVLAGIGSGSYHHTDEEMVRWIAAIIRHYAIDGRTDSLAEKFGYKYNPGFIANPDFDDGLKDWTVDAVVAGGAMGSSRPTVAPLRIPGYGGSRQGRQRAGSAGDCMAFFVRESRRANRLSQKISGLVPGRHYALVFYSSDYDEYLGMKENKTGIPQGRRRLRADFLGGENVPSLELHHYGASGIKAGKLSICRNRYVFRADAPEVVLAILDRDANEGEAVTEDIGLRQIVNFVEMHEYYTGGLSVDEIAKMAAKR